MNFIRKNWSNLLFILIILLLMIPHTRKPIQVGLNRLIAFSPSEISEEKRVRLEDYNWRLQGINGEEHDFRTDQGEVVLINFWATWCPPCIAEMPSFQKLYDDYEGKIKFYFVSSEEAGTLRQFLEKKRYHFPVYRPLSATPELLRSNSLPTTFVLSKTGELVVNKRGAANWNDNDFRDLLDELLVK